MTITIHPDAEEDVAEAAAFYERKVSPALGARFVAEFKRVAQLVAENPVWAPARICLLSAGLNVRLLPDPSSSDHGL